MPASNLGWMLERFPTDTTNPLDIPSEEITLPLYLHWLFNKSGLSRADYSERIGKSLGYVSGMFSGHISAPPIPVLRKLAALHNVPMVKFLMIMGALDQPEIDQWNKISQHRREQTSFSEAQQTLLDELMRVEDPELRDELAGGALLQVKRSLEMLDRVARRNRDDENAA